MYADDERPGGAEIEAMGEQYGMAHAIEALMTGDRPSDSPLSYPDEAQRPQQRDLYDEGYRNGVHEVYTLLELVSEAYVVGKSRGDDAVNYALAYGEDSPSHPTDIPHFANQHEVARMAFTIGWDHGGHEAAKRHKELG